MTDESVFPKGLASDQKGYDWDFFGGGLTKRELFAAMFVQAFSSLPMNEKEASRLVMDSERDSLDEVFAERAVERADVLLAELARKVEAKGD